MKILIVEDDENSRILLETALSSEGYEVLSACNGKIALKTALNDPPDIIISDILMPEMDGYALCKELKSNDLLRRIPFIFYTATYTDPNDERLAMNLGAVRFIVKPMEIDLLLEEIRIVLKNVGNPEENYPDRPLKDEKELDREYSSAIARKLDKKVRQLEEERNKLKRSEGIVKQNLQKLHAIIDNIGMGIVLINRDMKIVEMNRKMRDWFPEIDPGMNPLCYESFNDPPKDDICDYCPTKKTFDDGAVHEGISRIKRKDVVRTYRVVSSPLFDENGEIKASIEIVEDITDKIEIESKLRHAQKLEAIGTLAGGIAHDFNNILTSILGYNELALEDVDNDSKVEKYLNEIYTAGKRAKDLVHQILLFARESKKERRPVNIGKIIIEVMKFIRSSIPTTIDIIQEINCDSMVLGDSTQIHQIMMNLCTNAAQSMDDYGTLKVALNDIIMDCTLAEKKGVKIEGKYVELIVSDTGSGISKDIIDKIFTPYYTTKNPGEGTGLGLSLVHGIVESYGGNISVNSEEGKGTSFLIYLPVVEKQSDIVLFDEEVLPTGNESILYVDDEKAIGKIGEEILSRLGYSVTVKDNSVEALGTFISDPDSFDLVITDMTMPNLSGDKLAIELLKIRHDIPVILLTGYNKRINPEIASRIGIKKLLYKPIIKSELAKTVRKVIDGL